MRIFSALSAFLLLLPAVMQAENTLQDQMQDTIITPDDRATEVTPTEDLMREHGVLRRLLLIYEEMNRRFSSNTPFEPKLLQEAAQIMQTFIGNYHEKLEEDYLFSRLEKREAMKELVKTLLEQHQKGRQLTSYILQHARAADLTNPDIRKGVSDAMLAFITMYRPHAAREDTVLYPYFKTIISGHEYLYLGDVFENKETELFGEGGFSKIVDKVAAIEKALGIYALDHFTARQ